MAKYAKMKAHYGGTLLNDLVQRTAGKTDRKREFVHEVEVARVRTRWEFIFSNQNQPNLLSSSRNRNVYPGEVLRTLRDIFLNRNVDFSDRSQSIFHVSFSTGEDFS